MLRILILAWFVLGAVAIAVGWFLFDTGPLAPLAAIVIAVLPNGWILAALMMADSKPSPQPATTASIATEPPPRDPGRGIYWRVRPWEPLVYRAAGVRLFKQFMTSPLGRRLSTFPRLAPTLRAGFFPRLESLTRAAEGAHAATFIFAALLAAASLAQGHWCAGAMLLTSNMLVNGYPIMLQRWNRARLARR